MQGLMELSPSLKSIFEGLGERSEDEVKRVLNVGLKELLRECEEEILDFEIKYGLPFERFKENLEAGRLGDLHSYPLEKDAMIWEDLVREKQTRLDAIRRLERLS